MVEFRQVDAIQCTQILTKHIKNYISKITCLIKIT